MSLHPMAGQRAQESLLVDLDALVSKYYRIPDASRVEQCVVFGTSGHRGSSLRMSFNEAHILAIAQAVVDYRKDQGYLGPLFVGKDTHALSLPAERSVLEVLAANGVLVIFQEEDGFTPTPVISRHILAHNANHPELLADGLVITPSHNPPEDGGIKYNPPHGGPADTDVTNWIEQRANHYLQNRLDGVRRVPYEQAVLATNVNAEDLAAAYIEALGQVIDMAAIRDSGLRIGVDPMGGAAVHYWSRIAKHYGLNIEVVNPSLDPRFAFMPLDHDGKIRMDCSSPYAMLGLLQLKDRFEVAWGNDADVDRHGIVVPELGLLNPNHYLALAIDYLLTHRENWPVDAAIGKTVVSSSLIDRVVAGHQRRLYEVPVGFKWFSTGLLAGNLGFCGEESAGASFLDIKGHPWATDKDGIILGLLAAEMIAVTGQRLDDRLQALFDRYGQPAYLRVDAAISPEKKAAFKQLTAAMIDCPSFAGECVLATMTHAPGNGAGIGGIKVMTENAWFAARPSGTEDIFKIYAESFLGEAHLKTVLVEAQSLLDRILS